MYSVSEKRMLWRFISCLIAFSILLLIFSSLSLIEFTDNSLPPESVVEFIDSDNALISSRSNDIDNTEKNLVFEINKTSIEDIEEPERFRRKSCDESNALIRVYMYDLPPLFHFGLLGWKGNKNQIWPSVTDSDKIPSHPGGLNLQHSIEYWLTLDLLASNTENVVRPCSAIRVKNSSEADVLFVPFFSSLSYNRHSKRLGKHNISVDRLLQERLVEFLKRRDEWKKSSGRNHLIVAHHPNSMLFAREKLGSAMFVLADFGRYPIEIANIEKDVIAPYKHMVRTIAANNSAPFNERPTLVYFQGAIYRKDVSSITMCFLYVLNFNAHFFWWHIDGSIEKVGRLFHFSLHLLIYVSCYLIN